jgi:hypothetical protein
MRTALHLRDYEDILDPQEIYAFLGLAAFYNGFFGQCSKVHTHTCICTHMSLATQYACQHLHVLPSVCIPSTGNGKMYVEFVA